MITVVVDVGWYVIVECSGATVAFWRPHVSRILTVDYTFKMLSHTCEYKHVVYVVIYNYFLEIEIAHAISSLKRGKVFPFTLSLFIWTSEHLYHKVFLLIWVTVKCVFKNSFNPDK